MQKWSNGDRAEDIKNIIDNNFSTLGKHLPNTMLSLSTSDRELLGSDYLSTGLRVFDTDLNKWFRYDGSKWVEWTQEYVKYILESDWIGGNIYIPFSEHQKSNPIVAVFILENDVYSSVLVGIEIDSQNNITLLTDLKFDGKVVIK